MLTKIYHKKNELFQIEFYQDKECTNLIKDLPYSENAKKSDISNFYIEIEKGDIAPITFLLRLSKVNDYFYTPYLPSCQSNQVKTLDDIAINFSKYIPKDNAVLFLSEEDANKHSDNCESWFLYQKDFPARRSNSEMDIRDWKAITIFLTHGTESELKRVNEIAQELDEKYGVEEVNVFVLHCFVNLRPTWLPQISFLNGILTFHFFNILTHSKQEIILAWEEYGEKLENNYYCTGINTITTTNSTKVAYIVEDCHSELDRKFNILDC